MTSIILGSGGAGGAAIGGDLGGTNASPQVIGAHFGGNAGNFWVNRAGVWVPDTIKSTDLPAISQLTNGANTLIINADGSITATAPATTLGALQTNVASQYLSGNNVRGYFRVTVSATAVAANANFITINFSQQLSASAYVLVTPLASTSAQYGDSVSGGSVSAGIAYPTLLGAVNTPMTSFSMRCTSALTASSRFAFVYQVIE